MSEKQFEEVVTLALSLSPGDKIRLIEYLAASLEDDLKEAKATPKRSLYGLLADQGIDISEEDIDEIRREMWANFPREHFFDEE